MGWLGSIFGSRKRREARRALEVRLLAELEAKGARAVWPEIVSALRRDPEAGGLFHLAARALREAKEPRTAELFDRAADAPHDPQRLFELGSELLSREQAEVAAVLLERAIAFVPFDAVVRSELALAYARSGEPERVLATLALHPCLADDPGALFELAWASLLIGDLETAAGAARELHGASALRRKLDLAIDRALVSPAMRDARDFYFVEHGGVLVDAGGPLAGRYRSLHLDAERTARIVGDLGAVIARLRPRPRHVIALDEEHWPLAEAVATACGGSVLAAGRGRVPPGVLPVLDGRVIEERVDDVSRKSDEVWLAALTLDWSRGVARAPELVGAFAKNVERTPDALRPRPGASAPSTELLDFVESRRPHLPPDGKRVHGAYVPDAPLPR